MSISNVLNSWLFDRLSNAASLLEDTDLKRSKIIVDNIQKQIKTEIPKINSTTLNEKRENLLNTIKEEFSQHGKHSKDVFTQLLDSVLKALEKNPEESNILQNNTHIDERYRRGRQYQIYKKLREESLIEISIAYSQLVSGVYASALRDCYAWKILSLGKSVDANRLKQQGIRDIHNYFKDNSFPLHYFNGWDPTVRNAVAHSNFYYDDTTRKMTYVNDPPTHSRRGRHQDDTTRKMTSSHS